MGGIARVVKRQTLDSEQKPASISKFFFFLHPPPPLKALDLITYIWKKTLKTVQCRTSYPQATSCDHCTF